MKDTVYNLLITILVIIIAYYLLKILNINIFNSINKFIIDIIFSDVSGHIKINDTYPKEYAYTYGEIQFDAMQNIFKESQNNNIDTFIDLGCGVGKGLVLAKFVGFKKVYGIEIIKERCDKALIAISKLPDIDKNDIFVYNKDFFDIDLKKFKKPVTIFISNLIFTEDVNRKLFDYIIDNTQKGTMIFCSKFNVKNYDKPLKYKKMISTPMSWCKTAFCFVFTVK